MLVCARNYEFSSLPDEYCYYSWLSRVKRDLLNVPTIALPRFLEIGSWRGRRYLSKESNFERREVSPWYSPLYFACVFTLRSWMNHDIQSMWYLIPFNLAKSFSLSFYRLINCLNLDTVLLFKLSMKLIYNMK